MERPAQAVILCGGLGERLRPLTEDLPKPLAPVGGRPFLEYLICQSREQQVERVVLLTGYYGEKIRDHFGDGAGHGVQIDYSSGPADWDTGRRIWEARTMLDCRFLLLYSDNYVPVNIEKLLSVHSASLSAVTLLLHQKQNGNVRLDVDGGVEVYDSTRSTLGLNYVEIGYMIIERDRVLGAYGVSDVSFSRILEKLVKGEQVAGLVSGDSYHSISDLDRLKLAEQYLAVKRVLMIDRDGTINKRAPRGEYIGSWSDFHWDLQTVEAMRQLARKGFRFLVLSNQAGIARGMLKAKMVDEINARMISELRKQGIDVIDVYVCPHHWDEGCSCRKPNPGMFFKASRSHLLRMDRTVYVGDDPRDSRAAFNAECLSVLIGPERERDPGGGAKPSFTGETMLETVPWIVSRYESWEESYC
tara:strand:- start:985 stop:2232 length:1248 start_codon:yes stop_codon:yes gene_type:complete